MVDTRVLDMELIAREHGERRNGPLSQRLSHPDALPVRLAYHFVLATEQGERLLDCCARSPRAPTWVRGFASTATTYGNSEE